MVFIELSKYFLFCLIQKYTHMHTWDVSVAEWLAWLAGNCGRIGAIGSSPSNVLKPYMYIHIYIHTYIHTHMDTCVLLPTRRRVVYIAIWIIKNQLTKSRDGPLGGGGGLYQKYYNTPVYCNKRHSDHIHHCW